MRNPLTPTIAIGLTAAAMLTAFSLCAEAQTPPAQNETPGTASPNASQPLAAEPDNKPGSNEPLSKKLDKNEGVLKPPSGVDPGMHQQPPAQTGDKMPIIIPPGEPGGNQDVQPK